MNRQIVYDVAEIITKYSLDLNKIGIVGSRRFPSPNEVDVFIKYCLEYKCPHIVSGGGGIVDKTAATVAKFYNLQLTEFLPKKRYPSDKLAYLERNKQIAEFADCVVAFYDGLGYRNSGTLNTVEHCAKLNKPFWIITP